MDARHNQRGADDPAAEDVAVPDEDRVADKEPRQHPGREMPSTPPEAGGYAGVLGPLGPQVPSPPSGEPPQRPPPDPGYAFGSDMPIGIGEDSPMNEGSEDIAAPPVDPAEHRPTD